MLPQELHEAALEVFDAWQVSGEQDEGEEVGEVVLSLHGTPRASLFVDEHKVFEQEATTRFVELALRLIAQGVEQVRDSNSKKVYELAGAAHADQRAELVIVANLEHPQVALVLVPTGVSIQDGVILWRLAVPTPATMH